MSANGLSVRLELQADCYAGVWANSVWTTPDQANVKSITEADVKEALDAAAAVGDDRIQEQATGTIDKESWTHGSADQRAKWFNNGFKGGSTASCDTFGAATPRRSGYFPFGGSVAVYSSASADPRLDARLVGEDRVGHRGVALHPAPGHDLERPALAGIEHGGEAIRREPDPPRRREQAARHVAADPGARVAEHRPARGRGRAHAIEDRAESRDELRRRLLELRHVRHGADDTPQRRSRPARSRTKSLARSRGATRGP